MSPELWDSRDESSEFARVAEYPPVSRLAVLSVILAVLASGVIFIPLLICAAVAGALVAVAALWSIAHAAQPMLGRKAAIAALLGCVFVGAWGTTWRLVRERVLFAEAKQHADRWLQLVQAGRREAAYQLHLDQDSRLALDEDFEEHLNARVEARYEYEGFWRGEPVAQIVKAGPQGQVQFLGYDEISRDSHLGQIKDFITLRYAFTAPSGEEPQTTVFLVQMLRTIRSGDDEARWELRSVELPKK